MDIFEKTIQESQIISEDGTSRWGAKGIILTHDGKLETEEFLCRTREEAVRKAQQAMDELLRMTQKSSR